MRTGVQARTAGWLGRTAPVESADDYPAPLKKDGISARGKTLADRIRPLASKLAIAVGEKERGKLGP